MILHKIATLYSTKAEGQYFEILDKTPGYYSNQEHPIIKQSTFNQFFMVIHLILLFNHFRGSPITASFKTMLNRIHPFSVLQFLVLHIWALHNTSGFSTSWTYTFSTSGTCTSGFQTFGLQLTLSCFRTTGVKPGDVYYISLIEEVTLTGGL